MEWVLKLLPEIWLSFNILTLLAILSVYRSKTDLFFVYHWFNFSNIVLIVTLIIQIILLTNDPIANSSLANIYSVGVFEVITKIFIAFISVLISFVTSFYFKPNNSDVGQNFNKFFNEVFLVLYQIIILGSFVLVSSTDLLTFLIGFELIAIPSYVMIALDNKNKIALEGSMKYFIIGSLATISIIISALIFYVYSGSFYFGSIFNSFDSLGFYIAFGFLMVGIFVKLAVFPFSLWIQDAYYGSRSPYLLIISTLPKFSILVVFIKILYLANISNVDIISIFSALSMLVGTFGALMQRDIKKIIAFSSILNMGYILIPFTNMNGDIFQAFQIVYFYILQYTVSVVLLVSVLIYLEEKYNTTDLFELSRVGIYKDPVLVVSLIISLLSLAGLPPTVGFIAKFYLFSFSYSFAPLLVWLGIITSVISLYFYYKIAHTIYVEEKSIKVNENNNSMGLFYSFSNIFLCLIILFLGIFPDLVFSIINTAFYFIKP